MEQQEAIKQAIIQYSKQIGINAIGFASVASLFQGKERYQQYRELGYSTNFEDSDIERRTDASFHLAGAKTVIAVAIAYPGAEISLTCEKYEGVFCRASWGEDYHKVVHQKLQQLGDFCKKQKKDSSCITMVDTGSLSDREAAVCCGLGWIGKNSNLIIEHLGSFVFLGQIIIDYAVPADKRIEEQCGSCYQCQKHCPVAAIDGQRRMVDSRKCLAYKTLDKRFPEKEIIYAIGKNGYIYGCDICQLACPHNQNKKPNIPKEFFFNAEKRAINLLDLFQLSNKTFREQYGSLSGSWRGKGILQRNALFILGSRRLQELKNVYQEILDDTNANEDIKMAAQWAVEQLNQQ